ncbi:type II toxin-antitoxin system PemK/MazF family toxin [Dapis sp. BLCC M126]|uniref:type II toxin-antitoxin system PemK/MazF family toxin n=1 Tax=Dapis sp. BLCC M126 TaxID=3400189 RepID=UPI003CEB66A0
MANPSPTKGKIVLVPFPFDDLSSTKVRPAVCLTNPVGQYNHIILAFITSKVPTKFLETHILLDTNHPDFTLSGLRKSSVIKLDVMITLRTSLIRREIGKLSSNTQTEIAEKLYKFLTE